jgi:hypothetical protein
MEIAPPISSCPFLLKIRVMNQLSGHVSINTAPRNAPFVSIGWMAGATSMGTAMESGASAAQLGVTSGIETNTVAKRIDVLD